MMVDDTGEVEPAACALTAEQARELAFELLAARRARRQRSLATGRTER